MRSKKLAPAAGFLFGDTPSSPRWEATSIERSTEARSSASCNLRASPRKRAAASFSVAGASVTPARNLRSTPVTGVDPRT